ncbi:MAG TPA: sialidase family protein [Noviherbaspirillum sp.]|nr:sialidase family protein [Noviherbaspirillum sp.]
MTDIRRRIAAFALGVLTLPAFAHDGHAGKGAAQSRPPRPELASSAAFDAQGRLWVAYKLNEAGRQFVAVQSSDDLGNTWSAAQRAQQEPEPVSADGENRPKIAFGPGGDMYLSYTKPLSKPYTGDIRFVRSQDGGRSFTAPVTVHANRDLITHRFDSLIVDREGRVYVTWIDKRDLHAAEGRKQAYRGAAVYYAVSTDRGASFNGDFKIADHSCECCRIALALDEQGRVAAMWRHVFAPNARDHAWAVLGPEGRTGEVQRASFDDWRVDACPHHGPGLAFGRDGTRHQVWFNVKDGEGGVFYASVDRNGVLGAPTRLGSGQVAHADVAVLERRVVLAWRQFDGKASSVVARVSHDEGRTWQETEVARTAGASDQPRLVAGAGRIVLVWRTEREGFVVRTLAGDGT